MREYLEKNSFKFELGTKRLSKIIKSDIEKLCALSEKSYLAGLFQAALYYFCIAFEMVIKSKLKLAKFREKLSANKKSIKDIDEMPLGLMLSIDDEINKVLFKNYDKNTKDCVKIVRNINTHKFNPLIGPDITSKMTDIIELSKKIR